MKEDKHFIGMDFGYMPKWWQRILIFLRLKRYGDYSVAVVYKQLPNGGYEMIRADKFHLKSAKKTKGQSLPPERLT